MVRESVKVTLTRLFVLALGLVSLAGAAEPSFNETRALAEHGLVIAQYNLGVMYAHGSNVGINADTSSRAFSATTYCAILFCSLKVLS